jgi:hypothetical protein
MNFKTLATVVTDYSRLRLSSVAQVVLLRVATGECSHHRGRNHGDGSMHRLGLNPQLIPAAIAAALVRQAPTNPLTTSMYLE